MKKSLFVLLLCLQFALTSCAGSPTENEDTAAILASVLDSILYQKQSETADDVLEATPEETRENFIAYAEAYYMGMELYTREQCRAVSEKILQKASEIMTYRIEEADKDDMTASFNVYFTAVDKDAFYAKYDELAAEKMGAENLSEAEKSIISFDVYMETLDYLTASDEERVLETTLTYGAGNWKVADLPKMLVSLFGIIIGAEDDPATEAGTARSVE